MDNETIDRLYSKGIFTFLDMHFGQMMEKLDDNNNPSIFLTAALLSSFTRQGQVCLDLGMMEGRQLLTKEENSAPVFCPDINTWISELKMSSIVGNPGEFKPLIMDNSERLLYLHRYFQYQETLIRFIKSRVGETVTPDFPLLKKGLARMFPQNTARNEIDWQKIAAIVSCLKKICVISGGPGTGKTTTIVRIITLILEQTSSKVFKIALLAPTGKAAMRLREAIQDAKEQINCPDYIRDIIPNETSTIHRFLGTIFGSPYFKHNEKNLLDVDMVIVDEASMVDIALMAKLIHALPQHTSLILVGDKDQLASVEAGAVFGDICNSGNSSSFSGEFADVLSSLTGNNKNLFKPIEDKTGVNDCIVQFQTSYRFGKDSGIGAVSRAVNNGAGDRAIDLLKDDAYPDIQWHDLPRPKDLPEKLQDFVINGFQKYLNANDPSTALKEFDSFRILCALREGPYGVHAINNMIEATFRKERIIQTSAVWYPLRPIMITSNNYQLQLFNGDTGIVLPNREDNNRPQVYFSGKDSRIRTFYPDALADYETVYAMTVHKSQGSEFEKTILILPDQESPVLTRGLIYTGITRTQKELIIWGEESVFLNAVSRSIKRTSGLLDAFKGSSF